MSEILQGFLFCLGAATFFICGIAAISAPMRSSQLSRDEESGAPEGDITHSNHFQCPDASGSKLSVRASYQSVPSIRSVSRRAGG
jgi:hypothetical protein